MVETDGLSLLPVGCRFKSRKSSTKSKHVEGDPMAERHALMDELLDPEFLASLGADVDIQVGQADPGKPVTNLLFCQQNF